MIVSIAMLYHLISIINVSEKEEKKKKEMLQQCKVRKNKKTIAIT